MVDTRLYVVLYHHTVLYSHSTWPWRCRWWARGRARPRPRSRSCPGSAAAAPRTSGPAGKCFSPKYFYVVKQIFLDKNFRYFSHLLLHGVDGGVVELTQRVEGDILHLVDWLASVLQLQHCMGSLNIWEKDYSSAY